MLCCGAALVLPYETQLLFVVQKKMDSLITLYQLVGEKRKARSIASVCH